MKAKVHIRKQPNGNYYIQGIIPKDNNFEIKFNDCIALIDIEIDELEDRTAQYSGKSNKIIAQEGFV